MSKTNETTAHDHSHMTIADHPHRGPASEIKLRDGDCAVIFRKGDCPEFITNVPDGEEELVTSDNFMFSPYYMTDLLFAAYYGHPALAIAMNMLAKIHAKTSEHVQMLSPDGAGEQQPQAASTEETPGLDNPVVSVH